SQVAGTFCCAPTFGAGNHETPPHGVTANNYWRLLDTFEFEKNAEPVSGACWVLDYPDDIAVYRKWDLLIGNNACYCMCLEVENKSDSKLPINLAWHGTLGAPFLERGCRILSNCERFSTPPKFGEFEETSVLEQGREFNSLRDATAKDGNIVNMSYFSGFTGTTDLVCGTTPNNTNIAWAACINPHLRLAYIVTVPYDIISSQANPNFYIFWYQQGGRNFSPWADCEGGSDRSMALGLEVTISGFANGLDWSLMNPVVMKKPTFITLSKGEKIRFPCLNLIVELPFSTPDLLNSVSDDNLSLYIDNVATAHTNHMDMLAYICDKEATKN
ncbi:hypothetical protein ACE1BM_17885, partial [Aeromonas jandaei]